MQDIPIHTPYITLGQFLKLSDCISTGGQAKAFLSEHRIEVNREEDNRRGRKLYPGDTVNVEGIGQFRVIQSD
ncbi:MAG: RNA-binding protein [Paenibacillaceae bacterium]|jgi:S4 domain protein YaaA|nr:RNA-binding protein [Paenibacillaceae bacterium]